MKESPGTDPDLRAATNGAIPSPPGHSDNYPPEAIKLWTPRGIGWSSVLIGFPGAAFLAALNWRRMGRARKAVVHLVAAVVGTWALFFVNASYIGLALGIAVGYYLFRAQRSDQASLIATGRVTERGGLVGAVLGIIATIVIVGSGAVIATPFGGGGVAHRGDVLFGRRAGTDICSPEGQATVFGPADPIFVGAVMRETVQPGSHVVIALEGPSDAAGTYPISVQPPFNCVGTTSSIGPLDPGTYVFRYRYADKPGAPDLAMGSFTVTATPAGSASSSP